MTLLSTKNGTEFYTRQYKGTQCTRTVKSPRTLKTFRNARWEISCCLQKVWNLPSCITYRISHSVEEMILSNPNSTLQWRKHHDPDDDVARYKSVKALPPSNILQENEFLNSTWEWALMYKWLRCRAVRSKWENNVPMCCHYRKIEGSTSWAARTDCCGSDTATSCSRASEFFVLLCWTGTLWTCLWLWDYSDHITFFTLCKRKRIGLQIMELLCWTENLPTSSWDSSDSQSFLYFW